MSFLVTEQTPSDPESPYGESKLIGEWLLAGGRELEAVDNLGSGKGASNREIMIAIATATGIDFQPDPMPRRPGDPARIVDSGARAARDLDWKMRHTLQDMVQSAWQARQAVRCCPAQMG